MEHRLTETGSWVLAQISLDDVIDQSLVIEISNLISGKCRCVFVHSWGLHEDVLVIEPNKSLLFTPFSNVKTQDYEEHIIFDVFAEYSFGITSTNLMLYDEQGKIKAYVEL